MTILGPETIKAIEDHKMAPIIAERNRRLAEIQAKQRRYQIRQMVNAGYGYEDIAVELGVSREIAKEAVFGRGK